MAQDFYDTITQVDFNSIVTKLTNLYNTYRKPNVTQEIDPSYQPPTGVSVNDKITAEDLTIVHTHYRTKIGNLNNPDLGMPSQNDIILDDPFESLYNAIAQINFIQQQPCYSCDNYYCTCDGSCDTYSCDCESACDGYSQCICYATYDTYLCQCDSTCYVESCTCDSTCYEYDICSCHNQCYLDTGVPGECACDYSWYYACTCDATCYGEGCGCDFTCYGYSCDCYSMCNSDSSCGCDFVCDSHFCVCEGTDYTCGQCYSQSYVCSTGY